MNENDAKLRVDNLRKLINDYRYHYHVLDESTMSEAAADSLKHELSKLEHEFPHFITSDSPTQRVAGEVSPAFTAARHSTRMLSLNDVFNGSELEAWQTRIKKLTPENLEFFVDLKMDGLACALIYEDGLLVRAITRGDGTMGEDVTANIRTINSVPLRLEGNISGTIEVRGEIVMYKNDFATLNEEREKQGKPLFANPRNTAAGTIRQLDPRLVAARPLQFHAYDLTRYPDGVASYADAYQKLRQLGFRANKESTVLPNLKQVKVFADTWDNQRHDLPFHTDGLVVKINDKSVYTELGVVGKAPRGAVAYKYAAEEATTVVKDIVISIGRTGAATPVAVFDPVVVAGSTVKHASLHNADEIIRKDIRIGDTVIIYKAGDIIPQVQKVLTELRPKNTHVFNFEAELVCQYPELSFDRPEGEAVYRVHGVTGPTLIKRALEHFASKGALDIDTLGEKNVTALIDEGLVTDLADIYSLTKEQVLSLERFADISATKMIDAISSAKTPPLERFLYGLGIRHVGVQTAIDLVKAFGSLEALAQANIDDLKNVEGVGEVVAESVVAWFADPDNVRMLTKFTDLEVNPHYDIPKSGPLSEKSFVVTGTLESMSREAAADKVRSKGGIFQSSVGKGTIYLVAGAKVGASKLEKARKLGVTVIDEAEFLKLVD